LQHQLADYFIGFIKKLRMFDQLLCVLIRVEYQCKSDALLTKAWASRRDAVIATMGTIRSARYHAN